MEGRRVIRSVFPRLQSPACLIAAIRATLRQQGTWKMEVSTLGLLTWMLSLGKDLVYS
jgi:hypothetical protein